LKPSTFDELTFIRVCRVWLFTTTIALCCLIEIETASAHSPHDDVEVVAISPQFDTDKTMFCAFWGRTNFMVKSLNGGISWSPCQFGLSLLEVTAMAISPQFISDKTVFAGSDGEGVDKSTNGGDSWLAVNNGLSDLHVTTLAISPGYDKDQTLYAGGQSGSVFGSQDGGDSWEICCSGLPGSEITALEISPAYSDDRIIYAGTAIDGVYISTNSGKRWYSVNNGLDGKTITSLALSPDYFVDSTIFAGTLTKGLFKSTDDGQIWSALNSGIDDHHVAGIDVSPAFSTDRTVFCVCNDKGAYKSTDAGKTWELHEADFEYRAPQSDKHFIGVECSPDYAVDGRIFVLMFEGLFKSGDRGNKYFQLNIYPQTLMRFISISPAYQHDRTLVASTYGGGAYRSTDGGASWETVNTGISFRFLTPIEISPSFETDNTIWTGTLKYVNMTTDRGDNWLPIKVDTGGNYVLSRCLGVSTDFANDRTLYCGNQPLGLYPLYRSTDGGASYQPVPVAVGFVTVIKFSPDYVRDGTIFLGTQNGVIVSTDRGVSWSATGMDKTIERLVFSPEYTTDRTVFMGEHFGGLFKSTDGGWTWYESGHGLPSDVAVTQIVMSDGFASDRTLLTSSVFSGVWKSTDGGDNWTYIGLGGCFIRELAISPTYTQDGDLFAGCWDGVYKLNPGNVWDRVLFLSRYEENSDLVLLKGNWDSYSSSLASERDVYFSGTSGDSVTFSFFGTAVNWLSTKADNLGIAVVYLDNVFIATVDQYSKEIEWQQVLHSVAGLKQGAHKLKIAVTGMKNSESAGRYVVVDAFEVIDS